MEIHYQTCVCMLMCTFLYKIMYAMQCNAIPLLRIGLGSEWTCYTVFPWKGSRLCLLDKRQSRSANASPHYTGSKTLLEKSSRLSSLQNVTPGTELSTRIHTEMHTRAHSLLNSPTLIISICLKLYETAQSCWFDQNVKASLFFLLFLSPHPLPLHSLSLHSLLFQSLCLSLPLTKTKSLIHRQRSLCAGR